MTSLTADQVARALVDEARVRGVDPERAFDPLQGGLRMGAAHRLLASDGANVPALARVLRVSVTRLAKAVLETAA